jgi:Ca-activated chloride channel family protein
MFREPLYLLAALPVVALAWAAYTLGTARRRRMTARLGDEPTLRRLMRPEAPGRRRAQAGLRLGALALIMLAVAGPQWGVEIVETTSASRDVVIAVDVSQSMLAEDVKPNRLARAIEELSLLIDELKTSRVGVIAFAGEPVVICPLTADTTAAKQLLRALDPGAVPVPGTAIGKAIRRAAAMLSRYPGEKTLVILTDGEDHKSDPVGAATEAAAEGVRIFTIGIGSAEGEPIPLKDDSGRVEGYKKDKRGATVVSRLGEAELAAIAGKTGGAYFRATPGAVEASEIVKRMASAGGAEEERRGTARRFRNHFMIPLALAFTLLLLEAAIPETSGEPGAETTTAPARAAGLTLLLLGLLLPGRAAAAGAESALRRGNALYDQQAYEPALEQYQRAAGLKPKDARPVFNTGDALYRLEQYDKAAEAFKAAAESGAGPAARENAFYNLGNAFFAKQDYGASVNAFRRAVMLDPDDEEARRNLAVALRRLKSPPPKKKDQKNNPKPQPQPQPKDKPEDKKDGGGGQPPNQPKTRPQDQLSKEDAERLMRAVSERERTGATKRDLNRAPAKRPDVEEDW